jgi:Kef-type K+ transport system membrane component KefB
VAPFTLGTLLSLFLYPRFSTSDVPFATFALLMGIAMSITAFPVLARILTDRGMQRTELGVVALNAASLGVLMNTRGLMELIVLNIGLDLGVISPGLFTMMVLMALVTTVATTPALRLIRPDALTHAAPGYPSPRAAS